MTTADDFVIQILTDRGLLTEETLLDFRSRLEASEEFSDIEEVLLDQLIAHEILDIEEVMRALADEFNMEYYEPAEIVPDAEAIHAMNGDLAKRYNVFPLQADEAEVIIATCDPLNVDAVDSLTHVLGKSVITALASPQKIQAAISEYYGTSAQATDPIFDGLEDAGTIQELAADIDPEDAGPIIRYVQSLIADAVSRRASDIHLEPLEKRFRVRFRIDGKLQEMENPPKRLQPSIIARLKLMAEVKLAEKRVPQDGRITSEVDGKDIDLRVSVLPTAHGESIVMRILDKEGLKLGLPELGFFSDDQATFEKIISMPDGVFLVTGPTGSGKSTTLYSGLNFINKPDRKIITVEDPVEYELTGINQVQVRKDVNMTFSSALRAILRQAPNIIMVGEIRDLETAEIAINASLTGHMVYSTLHTNDAPSAVTRLIDLGVKPFLVAASLRGAMAQRLIRQIHPECKEAYEPSIKELVALNMDPNQASQMKFMRAVPKPGVSRTGFKGRKGIFELFTVDDEMSNMIYEKRTLVELRRKARESGMRSMRDDGIRKIIAGLTTVDEVLSVTVDVEL